MQPFYQSDTITLYHGRCEDVIPKLTERPRLVLTDPPYGDTHDTDYTRFTGGVAAHSAPEGLGNE